MIAILEAKRAGLLSKHHWLNNILAGVIVGVVALPLAMAFAIASGAKPEQGDWGGRPDFIIWRQSIANRRPYRGFYRDSGWYYSQVWN